MLRLHRLALPLAALLSATLLPTGGAIALPGGAQTATDLSEIRKLIDHADYEEAEKALAPLVAKDPKAALLDAQVQIRTGKYAEAAALAKKITEKDLLDEAAAVRAEALFDVGDRDEAIKVLKAVESDAPARRARLLLGDYLIQMGKRGDARDPLMTLISDYNSQAISATDVEGLTMVGRAAHLLRSAKDANGAYDDAEKAGGKKNVETLLYRADLFLEKYNPGRAAEVAKEAEKISPTDPRVRVVLARINLEDAMDFDSAEKDIAKALQVNPHYAPAYFVRAGLALRDLDIEDADKAADTGLKTNPNDLELLSMKAAIRFLADDRAGFDAFEKKVFDLDPQYSAFYRIVGEYAEWEHRYEDIVLFMQKATSIDGRDAKAFADLGLNLIRAGREDEALKALRKAWDLDPFNVRVFNTLNLYEKTIANDYVTVDGQTFKIRYNKDEKAIMERYVPRMLDEAWASMVKRYHFTPTTPVQIELYANPEHFSVRTSGLPNVGIQGVCFGHTLALLSPHAGPFNWGNVLWHELGHIFAIQLSKNHVPRWFTEGLSEYETIVRRPEWKREEDPALYQGLREGRVPAVASFNRAFTHVNDIADVTMAYYAASQIIVFIAEKYGFDKVVAMMPLWASGERTPEVVKHALGITADELDRQYREWLKVKLARYDGQFVPNEKSVSLDDAQEALRTDPKNPAKEVSVARALLHEGKEAEAHAALSEALRLDAHFAEANYVLAELAIEGEKFDEADKLLKSMIENGHDGFAVRMKEAAIAHKKKDEKGLEENLWAAYKLDPEESEPLAHIAQLDEKRMDGSAEMEVLRKFTLLEQHDRDAWGKLLEGAVARGQWDLAVEVGESTLFVDVGNPEVHRLYARALARKGRFISAIYEYNSAIIAGADPDAQVEIYGELVTAYGKLGEKQLEEKAKEYLKLAKKHAAESEDESGKHKKHHPEKGPKGQGKDKSDEDGGE